MVRIVFVAIAGAIIGSVITHGSQIGVWAGLIIGGGGAILPLVAGTSALKCPYCGKRVKLGRTHCHHCGRPVGRAA